MSPVLEQERAAYADHQEEWTKAYPGRFVVVKGDQLLGAYETMALALAAGAAKFGLQPFLVRKLGEQLQEVHVPALSLGLLFAPPHSPARSGSAGS